MKFSTHLWHRVQPIYQEIATHSFNLELMNGTLSQERFGFYLQQDICYLIEFAKVLALIAGRATEPDLIRHFLKFSLSTMDTKRDLRSYVSTHYPTIPSIGPSPTCLAYSRYLLTTATSASLEEAITSILPCFWIYRELGKHIAKNSESENPYTFWITMNSSEEFSEMTDQVISLVDEAAEYSSSHSLALMERTFEYCTQFEWHFWNDAYHMNTFKKDYACYSCV